jgi:magnesium chelatase family protein
LQCEVVPLSFSDLSKAAPGRSGAEIRRNVIAAREIQIRRFHEFPGIHCNAQMTPKMLNTFVHLDESALKILRTVIERFNMSARAYEKILKVARTVADLAGSEAITPLHISEAVGYRSLDRSSWGE